MRSYPLICAVLFYKAVLGSFESNDVFCQSMATTCVPGDIAIFNTDIAQGVPFCTFWLDTPRTRSPIPELDIAAISNVCNCILGYSFSAVLKPSTIKTVLESTVSYQGYPQQSTAIGLVTNGQATQLPASQILNTVSAAAIRGSRIASDQPAYTVVAIPDSSSLPLSSSNPARGQAAQGPGASSNTGLTKESTISSGSISILGSSLVPLATSTLGSTTFILSGAGLTRTSTGLGGLFSTLQTVRGSATFTSPPQSFSSVNAAPVAFNSESTSVNAGPTITSVVSGSANPNAMATNLTNIFVNASSVTISVGSVSPLVGLLTTLSSVRGSSSRLTTATILLSDSTGPSVGTTSLVSASQGQLSEIASQIASPSVGITTATGTESLPTGGISISTTTSSVLLSVSSTVQSAGTGAPTTAIALSTTETLASSLATSTSLGEGLTGGVTSSTLLFQSSAGPSSSDLLNASVIAGAASSTLLSPSTTGLSSTETAATSIILSASPVLSPTSSTSTDTSSTDNLPATPTTTSPTINIPSTPISSTVDLSLTPTNPTSALSSSSSTETTSPTTLPSTSSQTSTSTTPTPPIPSCPLAPTPPPPAIAIANTTYTLFHSGCNATESPSNPGNAYYSTTYPPITLSLPGNLSAVQAATECAGASFNAAPDPNEYLSFDLHIVGGGVGGGGGGGGGVVWECVQFFSSQGVGDGGYFNVSDSRVIAAYGYSSPLYTDVGSSSST